MQPAANGWNLQRRRTRLSLSAWSRIVPPTHLSCNNLDRRSNQTNEATPCQSKTIQCCQQQTIGTKQSRNSKHFTRLCPLHPFLKPLFWTSFIYAFANFVWDYLSLQFSPSSTLFEISTGIKSRGAREMDCWGLERSGGKLQKITQTLFLLIRLASVELLYS